MHSTSKKVLNLRYYTTKGVESEYISDDGGSMVA